MKAPGSRTRPAMALMAVLLVLAGAPSAQARRAVVVEDIEPTVLLIHGGSFTSRAAVANKQAIEDAGWTTLEVTYPFGDVVAAYRAVAAQIPREGPVVAFGESAGGTIALWLAAHGKVDRAVSVGAPTDLTTLRPSQVAHESWRYSPARLEGSRASIYHWTKDPVVDCAQARAVEGAEVHLLDGVNHHGLPEGVAQRAIRRAVRAAARGA